MSEPEPETGNRGRVLLADDDPAVLRSTTLVLRSSGFEVDAVATGPEAAKMLTGGSSYDALVSDINMPGNQGLELLELLAKSGGVGVVLITGEPTLSTAVNALRLGAVDYVEKPVAPERLIVVVERAVTRGRALQTLQTAQAHATAFIEMATALSAALDIPYVPSRVSFSRSSPSEAGETHAVDPLGHLLPQELKRLSLRERDVLRFLAVGHTIFEVATGLELSVNTVRNHMKRVFTKLRVRSQVALLAKLAGHPLPHEPTE